VVRQRLSRRVASRIAGATRLADLDSDRAALLELHARERAAHLAGDADLLTVSMADFVWEATRGGLNRLSKSDIRDRFAAYFASVHYEVWDDLEPAHVSVSDDGTGAWMAVAIEARIVTREGDETERPARFESSWISTWHRFEDEWQMTGISSSVVERGSSQTNALVRETPSATGHARLGVLRRSPRGRHVYTRVCD
jgi:hypothetical protein